MNSKKSKIYTGFVLVAAFAALFAVAIFSLLDRTPENPPGTVGNTAGNLNNAGLFCEYDGVVYFSNAFDRGILYAMDPDEGNIRKINSAIVCNLIAGGEYLYYFQTGTAGNTDFASVVTDKGFNRYNIRTKKRGRITKDTIVNCQLVGNYLYLLAGTNDGPLFYKMKANLTEKVDLANYQINPSCTANGSIYYANPREGHALFALNPSNDAVSPVYDGALFDPVIEGDYVYYMDVSRDYCLSRYSFSEEKSEILTTDRADCFNVGGGYIYYQKNGADPQLKCIRTDGTDETVIAEGNFTHINMTSRFVYFQEFGDAKTLYHSYVGDSGYSKFSAAEAAVVP